MRQERAERTRSALVLAAAGQFDRQGYERTTLADVSRRAEVSKGALSFHFTNKAELADTVQSFGCAKARVWLARLREREQPALQTLVDMTHVIVRQLHEDELTRAGVRLTSERETPCESPLHLPAVWQAVFRRVATDAVADGSLSPGRSPRTVAALALSLVMHEQVRARKVDDGEHARLTDMWSLLLPSLEGTRTGSGWRPRAGGTEVAGGLPVTG
ncbi:TetR/AcrR family transcriptional regulator [Streptomyces durbertensis]|uniref:TetR/AcrR family transcriptional regulator n=1 Tax=Streptomyces durbertensis TaxID=2448886 RepID=A0ABR6EAR8_9ACTN|nr:ScbR family autoregulator-binding transcription factor [Streptomyces durbertensis]MBB1242421.1 TetR/AcrR family transcriptional regulator [Streptomyces durbertensis]